MLQHKTMNQLNESSTSEIENNKKRKREEVLNYLKELKSNGNDIELSEIKELLNDCSDINKKNKTINLIEDDEHTQDEVNLITNSIEEHQNHEIHENENNDSNIDNHIEEFGSDPRFSFSWIHRDQHNFVVENLNFFMNCVFNIITTDCAGGKTEIMAHIMLRLHHIYEYKLENIFLITGDSSNTWCQNMRDEFYKKVKLNTYNIEHRSKSKLNKIEKTIFKCIQNNEKFVIFIDESHIANEKVNNMGKLFKNIYNHFSNSIENMFNYGMKVFMVSATPDNITYDFQKVANVENSRYSYIYFDTNKCENYVGIQKMLEKNIIKIYNNQIEDKEGFKCWLNSLIERKEINGCKYNVIRCTLNHPIRKYIEEFQNEYAKKIKIMEVDMKNPDNDEIFRSDMHNGKMNKENGKTPKSLTIETVVILKNKYSKSERLHPELFRDCFLLTSGKNATTSYQDFPGRFSSWSPDGYHNDFHIYMKSLDGIYQRKRFINDNFQFTKQAEHYGSKFIKKALTTNLKHKSSIFDPNNFHDVMIVDNPLDNLKYPIINNTDETDNAELNEVWNTFPEQMRPSFIKEKFIGNNENMIPYTEIVLSDEEIINYKAVINQNGRKKSVVNNEDKTHLLNIIKEKNLNLYDNVQQELNNAVIRYQNDLKNFINNRKEDIEKLGEPDHLKYDFENNYTSINDRIFVFDGLHKKCTSDSIKKNIEFTKKNPYNVSNFNSKARDYPIKKHARTCGGLCNIMLSVDDKKMYVAVIKAVTFPLI